VPPASTGSTGSTIDRAPSKDEKEYFKEAMKRGSRERTMSITQVESLDPAELEKLREEFDVISTMEVAARKRKIVAFVTISFVVAGVLGAIILNQNQRASTRAANRADFERDASSVPVAERLTIYEVAAEPDVLDGTSEEEDTTGQTAEEEQARADREKQERAARWEAQKAAAAKRRAAKTQESQKRYEKLSPEEYAALMADSKGKTETKLKFSARKTSDDAAKEAAEKRKKRGDARAAEVVATFGRKRRQLGRCKSGEDEKVRAQFTVAPNGRVTGVKVTGTTNSIKRKCVRDILKQAIFPKGPETNTYAMPFTI